MNEGGEIGIPGVSTSIFRVGASWTGISMLRSNRGRCQITVQAQTGSPRERPLSDPDRRSAFSPGPARLGFLSATRRPSATEAAPAMKIILANPRGFCAGVNMAIESLETAARAASARRSTSTTRSSTTSTSSSGSGAAGVVFVETLDEVPEGGTAALQRPRRLARRSASRPASASCGRSTPPARWSPRSTWRPSSTPARGTRSS